MKKFEREKSQPQKVDAEFINDIVGKHIDWENAKMYDDARFFVLVLNLASSIESGSITDENELIDKVRNNEKLKGAFAVAANGDDFLLKLSDEKLKEIIVSIKEKLGKQD